VRCVAVPPSDAELYGPLAVVIGRNCRLIRKAIGATQDDLARHARSIGLDWTETRVGHFEKGRSAPTFATVLAVGLALELARREAAPELRDPVRLSDLIGDEGFAALTGRLDVVPSGWIADICRGDPIIWPPTDEQWASAWPVTEVEPGVRERRAARTAALVKKAQNRLGAALTLDVKDRSGLTEDRLAQQLGISRDRLAAVSFQLWNGTFSEERDRRAGPDANPQRKGRITRELRAELEKALAHHGDD
jgi:transcriptional regulator with XRE-family HTH domain